MYYCPTSVLSGSPVSPRPPWHGTATHTGPKTLFPKLFPITLFALFPL